MAFTTLVSGVGYSEEWSPTTAPAATPTWATLTSVVRHAAQARGRPQELDRFAAGISSSLLGNADRAFDPLYSAGANFGNVLPEKRFRRQAQWNSITYDLFQGFIDAYPQHWDIGNRDATVEMTVTDAFKVLQQATLPNSMYELVSKNVWTPDHWWKLNDSAGATSVIDSGSSPTSGTVRTATLGSTGVLLFDGGATAALLSPTPTVDGIFSGFGASPAGGMNLTISTGVAIVGGVLTAAYAGGTVTLDPADGVFGTSRYDLVTYHTWDGTVGVTDGTPAVGTPTLPSIPSNELGICYVLVSPSETVITAPTISEARTFVSLQGADILFPTAPWPQSTTAWSIVLWFNAAPQTTLQNRCLLTIGGKGGLVQNALEIFANQVTIGDLLVQYSTASTSVGPFLSGPVVVENAPHMVAVTLASDTKIRTYFDGILVDTSVALADLAAFGKDSYSLGSYYQNQLSGLGFATWDGSVQHFQVDDGSTLTAQNVADLYSAGVAALAGETTGQRVGRILDYIGWSATDRTVSTGDSTLGAYDLSGGTALDYLNTLADTEQGMFYTGCDGKLVWRGRGELSSDTRSRVSQATFTDSGSGLAYHGVSAIYDETKIFNDARITRQGGADQIFTDAGSVTSFFKRTYAKTVLNSTDQAAADHAAWAVARYKSPALRIEQLVVRPRYDPTNLWPQALGREIGDRITFVRTPQGVGSAISQDLIIEGVEHEITADDWVTTFKCSPTEATRYFIVDDASGTYAANSILDGSVLIGF